MNKIRATREAGNVKRYHCQCIIGENLDSSHQWNVAMLLLHLFPDCRKELLCAALTHDLGERWAGDVPAPTKRLLADAGVSLEGLESEVRERLGLNFQPALTDEEAVILRGLDLLECYMFAHDQVTLFGNQNLVTTMDNAKRLLVEQKNSLPRVIIEALSEYQNNPGRTQENFA